MKSVISELVSRGGRVKPVFNEYHVLKALITIYKEEVIGRISLSKTLSLSESSTRTLIKRLKAAKIINVDPVGGCYLTDLGRSLVSSFLKDKVLLGDIMKLLPRSFRLSKFSQAAMIKGGKLKLQSVGVTEVRDLAIRYGANAALIFSIEDGKLILPGPGEVIGENEVPELKRLRVKLNMKANDVLVIAFSDTTVDCEKALMLILLDFQS